MKIKYILSFTLFTLLTLLTLLLAPLPAQAEIYKFEIKGPIESITEEYVVDCFRTIKNAGNAKLALIEMDTPGGFDTSMRTIIKEILDAPVPVAVYVSPKGARAASAGFFITISADIAAMSPGTSMGAASPVSVTGSDIEDTMKKKVTNDAASYAKSIAKNRRRNVELAEKAVSESKSYSAEECLEKNLIEYIAADLDDLLEQLNGKEIVAVNGKKIILKTAGEKIITLAMSPRQKFLKTITNPNLAYFLLIFGLLGLYLEFTHPGAIIPGVIGGICLLLAFLAFQVLPINYIGLLLILLSIGFFIAEIKLPGFGVFGLGGVISFVLGSIMLISSPVPEMRPTMSIIIVFATCFALVFLFLTYKVYKAMKRKTETGQEGLIGEVGTARTAVTPVSGKVFVHGEWWNAVSDYEIPAGSRVRIESLENFVLKVSLVSKA
ncbi:MAG: nodulation protein NfeD [Candidatus Aminicenantes bacterium]|nr:nodulation protein NfeD [Candidatus Aminicenantes bacterium]